MDHRSETATAVTPSATSEIAYLLARTSMERRDRIAAPYKDLPPHLRDIEVPITPQHLCTGCVVPLHPGAERYYKEFSCLFHPENFEIVRVFSQRLMDAGRMDMEAWTDRSPDFVEAHHIRQYAYLAKIAKCPM